MPEIQVVIRFPNIGRVVHNPRLLRITRGGIMANGAARFGKGLITAAVILAFALSVPFLAFADNARGGVLFG